MAQCCTLLRKHKKKLDAFHHRRIQTILGITKRQQWAQHITSEETRRRWGDPMIVTQKVTARHLEWLGHLACMLEHRIPQKCLFGWLPEPRPQGSLTRRWRDVIRADLRIMQILESEWYEIARESRMEWCTTYREALAEAATTQTSCRAPRPPAQVSCHVCGETETCESAKRSSPVWNLPQVVS